MQRERLASRTLKFTAAISKNYEKKIRELEAEVATLKEAFRDALDNDNAAVKTLHEDKEQLGQELAICERKLGQLDPNWREDTLAKAAEATKAT
jgi:hypothetical protein